MTHQSFEPTPRAPLAVKRPFYKKKRIVIPAGLVLLSIVLGSCGGGGKSAGDAPAVSSSSSPAAAAPESAGAAPAEAAAASPAPVAEVPKP